MNATNNVMRFDPKYKTAATLFTLGCDTLDNGVATKPTFINALMAMRQVGEEIDKLKKAYASLVSIEKQLSEAAAIYAESHNTALDAGLVEGPDGTKTGTLHLCDDGEGFDYHLVIGKDRPVRANGDNITQSFLEKLPEAWVKTKLELSLTQVSADVRNAEAERLEEHPNAAPKSVDDYLATKGLIRPAKRTWTVSPM